MSHLLVSGTERMAVMRTLPAVTLIVISAASNPVEVAMI